MTSFNTYIKFNTSKHNTCNEEAARKDNSTHASAHLQQIIKVFNIDILLQLNTIKFMNMKTPVFQSKFYISVLANPFKNL